MSDTEASVIAPSPPPNLINFDAYISFRYASDGPFAQSLYAGLKTKEISVFWFTLVVRPGRNMMERTVSSLMKSTVFLPVMSIEMFNKTSESATDYVLAEWLAALIFYKSKAHLHTVRLRKICPILVDNASNISEYRKNFPADAQPKETIANVLDVFDRMYFNLNEVLTARVLNWTYRDIFDEMAMHHPVLATEQGPASLVDKISFVVNTANEKVSAPASSYDAFISYREGAADGAGDMDYTVVNKIVDLAGQQFNLHYGTHLLEIGDSGDSHLDRAIESIKSATIFIPLVSSHAVARMLEGAHDPALFDRLVAEWICALLFWHIPSCRLRSILPLITRNSASDKQAAYFELRSQVSNEIPHTTIRVVLEAFERLHIFIEPKLKSRVNNWTLNEILNRLMENMGMVSDYADEDWSRSFVSHLTDILNDLPGDRFINSPSSSSKQPSVVRAFMCNTVNVEIQGNADDRVIAAQFIDATNANVSCFVKQAVTFNDSKNIDDELKILKFLNSESVSRTSCVKVFGFGANYVNGAECKYFVMEAFGRDLGTVMGRQCGKLMVYSLALQTVECVRALHRVGIMHGDLKPKNILYHLDEIGVRVKLCDFDSARYFKTPFPFEGSTFKCTPAYMCPELCEGTEYYEPPGKLEASSQPDYFALGLILWQLFSGPARTSFVEDNNFEQLLRENKWKSQLLNIKDSLIHCKEMDVVIRNLCDPDSGQRRLKYDDLKQCLDGSTRLMSTVSVMRDALTLAATNTNSAISNILETRLNAFSTENFKVLTGVLDQIKAHNTNLTRAIGRQEQGSTLEIMNALQHVVASASDHNNAFRELKSELASMMAEIELNHAGTDVKLENIVSVTQHLQEGMEDVITMVNKIKNDLELFSVFTRQQAEKNDKTLGTLLHYNQDLSDKIISEIKLCRSESNTRLNKLLQQNCVVPTLFVVLPDISTNGTLYERFKPSSWIKDRFRFLFVCSHTLQIVCCGPDGTGYRFTAVKEWVAKAAPVILAGLCLLQLAMTASGIPIPIPGISHLYGATQKGTAALCQKLLKDTAIHIQKFKTDYGVVVDATQAAVQTAVDTNPSKLAESVDGATIPKVDVTTEDSRAACRAVHDLMEKYDPDLEKTGLRYVIAQSGISRWIADNDVVEDSFLHHNGQRKPTVAP
jgi:serine/threonine protein kinase